MGNSSKIIAIVALLVAVVALAVGFATFSATLTIDSEAIVEKNDQFSPNVNYSETLPICYYTDDNSKTNIMTGDIATAGYSAGTATGKVWSGISVPITMSHKSVTCEAEIENTSAYVAYLRAIKTTTGLSFASVGSGDDAASTTAINAVTANSSAVVTLGSDSATITNAAVNNTSTNGTIAATNGKQIVTLTIAYTGTVAPDGDIRITVPTISLTYKTQ